MVNFGQKNSQFQIKFGRKTEKLTISDKKTCKYLSKNRLIPNKIWTLNYKKYANSGRKIDRISYKI